MKKILLLIIAVIHTGQFAFGQSDYSVEDLKKMKNDTNKVNVLNELAWKFKNNDSIARPYALAAKRLSDSLSYHSGLSTSLVRLGDMEKAEENYNEAENYYLQSLRIEEKYNNTYGIVRAKIQLGKTYQKALDYDRALKYSSVALISCTTLENDALLASIHSTIASIYSDMNLFDLSLEAHYQSIKIRERIGEEKNLAKSYLNVGILYNNMRKTDQALFYLNKSKSLYEKLNNEAALSKVYIGLGFNCRISKELDSALLYYQKSLAIKNKLNLTNKEVVFNNIGAIHEEKEQFDLAIESYLKSIELATAVNNESQLLTTYYNLGRIYRRQNKNTKALDYLNKSLKLSEKHKENITRLGLLITIAETYEGLNDFKNASLFNEKHIVLRDSVDARYRAVEIVEANYQQEKKRNELLEKEQEISQEKNLRISAENKRKSLLLYVLAGGVLLLALLFFALFKTYKSKKAKELAEKNHKIEAQKNIELLKKQELKSIKAMINGQESERKRIAKDLHDKLGSMLSMVKLYYKSVEDDLDKLKEKNKQQYSQANTLLDDACVAVREIAHNMVSGVLTKFGLVAALEELKNTIEGTNTFQIELTTHGLDDRLENTIEMELYGIVQELIHNVIKHAKAKEVSVQLVKRTNEINLTVIDDGIGFDHRGESPEPGIGLKNVASRVDALKGKFQIDSGKGNGTTINIDIPV